MFEEVSGRFRRSQVFQSLSEEFQELQIGFTAVSMVFWLQGLLESFTDFQVHSRVNFPGVLGGFTDFQVSFKRFHRDLRKVSRRSKACVSTGQSGF